jgi:hypothetical protein
MSRATSSICERNVLFASRNRRCASSKKKTSFGLSGSPISGSDSYSEASSHIMNVLNSAGRSCISASSRTLTIPRPSSVVRRKSATSNSGEPKKASACCCSSSTILRTITPTVAVATPPYSAIFALPSSDDRWLSSARRSSRLMSGS